MHHRRQLLSAWEPWKQLVVRERSWVARPPLVTLLMTPPLLGADLHRVCMVGCSRLLTVFSHHFLSPSLGLFVLGELITRGPPAWCRGRVGGWGEGRQAIQCKRNSLFVSLSFCLFLYRFCYHSPFRVPSQLRTMERHRERERERVVKNSGGIGSGFLHFSGNMFWAQADILENSQ